KRLATIATDVPIEFSIDAVKAQELDLTSVKAVYKELEFFSLLKELGPAEDTRERDYRVFENSDELESWLAAVPPDTPVALAISKSAEGEFALDTIGLAWQPGEARAVNSTQFSVLTPWLEDGEVAKIACDAKSALLTLDRMGIAARGFDHDVMV